MVMSNGNHHLFPNEKNKLTAFIKKRQSGFHVSYSILANKPTVLGPPEKEILIKFMSNNDFTRKQRLDAICANQSLYESWKKLNKN